MSGRFRAAVVGAALALIAGHGALAAESGPRLRIGHYSTGSGLIGFVIDRRGTPIKLRFDGSDEILALNVEPAPYDSMTLRATTASRFFGSTKRAASLYSATNCRAVRLTRITTRKPSHSSSRTQRKSRPRPRPRLLGSGLGARAPRRSKSRSTHRAFPRTPPRGPRWQTQSPSQEQSWLRCSPHRSHVRSSLPNCSASSSATPARSTSGWRATP